MNILGSGWVFHQDPHSHKSVGQFTKIYGFGVDPVSHLFIPNHFINCIVCFNRHGTVRTTLSCFQTLTK